MQSKQELAERNRQLEHEINERKHAEEELRRSNEAARQFMDKLKALHEVSIELSKTASVDELCRRTVELGLSHLGFDRLSLWFMDSGDPSYVVGSYGTDESGQIRDERGSRIKASFDEMMVESFDKRVLVSRQLPNAPLYNEKLEVVGEGWHGAGKLWDGDENIGWLFADNLLSQQPLSESSLELLALYAATVGHLVIRKRAEESLFAERNVLRTVIDTLPDQIYVKDKDSRFIIANSATAQFLGVERPQDLVGKTDLDLLPPEQAKVYFDLEQMMIGYKMGVLNLESLNQGPNGNLRWVLGTKLPFRNSQGEILGLVGINRDITERKEAEKQALELALARERAENLTEFLSTISHDLKTPLTVIMNSLYLLERITDPANQQDKIRTIRAQTRLLEKYIQDILTISRLDHMPELGHEVVNPNSLLQDVAERLRASTEEKSIVITLDLAANLPTIPGDADELNRVFINLVENAIHYTPADGSIALQTRVEGDFAVVEIADSGMGIQETDLPHIFERFYRAKEARAAESRGTGLGLAIVKRIIEMHSGKIAVDSVLGQGTTFRVYLPVTQTATSAP